MQQVKFNSSNIWYFTEESDAMFQQLCVHLPAHMQHLFFLLCCKCAMPFVPLFAFV
jgi:hypothetical protein